MTADELNPVLCEHCDGTGELSVSGVSSKRGLEIEMDADYECFHCLGTGKNQTVTELIDELQASTLLLATAYKFYNLGYEYRFQYDKNKQILSKLEQEAKG